MLQAFMSLSLAPLRLACTFHSLLCDIPWGSTHNTGGTGVNTDIIIIVLFSIFIFSLTSVDDVNLSRFTVINDLFSYVHPSLVFIHTPCLVCSSPSCPTLHIIGLLQSILLLASSTYSLLWSLIMCILLSSHYVQVFFGLPTGLHLTPFRVYGLSSSWCASEPWHDYKCSLEFFNTDYEILSIVTFVWHGSVLFSWLNHL